MALGNPLPSAAFVLSVADVPVGANPPGGLTALGATTGGALAAGTYYYVVTATNGAGESLRSQEVVVITTGATSSVVLNWNPVAGATSYKAYRGTTPGGENVFFSAAAATTFTDVGGAGTGGTPPAVSGGAWDPVSLINSWDASYDENVSEYDVFNLADPLQVVGRANSAMSFGGYLADSSDTGQARILTHETAKDFLLVRVLWDGVNGFLARARVETKRLSNRAGANLAEVTYTFKVLPSSIVPIGLGPAL